MTLNDEDSNNQDESKIINHFINHFTSIAEQLSSKIPHTQRDAKSYLNNRVQLTFFLTPITPNEINTVINDLKDNCNKVNILQALPFIFLYSKLLLRSDISEFSKFVQI